MEPRGNREKGPGHFILLVRQLSPAYLTGEPLDFRNLVQVAPQKGGPAGQAFPRPTPHCYSLVATIPSWCKSCQAESVAMTLDRYLHVLPSMGDQTTAAMEAALS